MCANEQRWAFHQNWKKVHESVTDDRPFCWQWQKHAPVLSFATPPRSATVARSQPWWCWRWPQKHVKSSDGSGSRFHREQDRTKFHFLFWSGTWFFFFCVSGMGLGWKSTPVSPSTTHFMCIPNSSEFYLQSNFFRSSDPWNSAEPLSSFQHYVKLPTASFSLSYYPSGHPALLLLYLSLSWNQTFGFWNGFASCYLDIYLRVAAMCEDLPKQSEEGL